MLVRQRFILIQLFVHSTSCTMHQNWKYCNIFAKSTPGRTINKEEFLLVCGHGWALMELFCANRNQQKKRMTTAILPLELCRSQALPCKYFLTVSRVSARGGNWKHGKGKYLKSNIKYSLGKSVTISAMGLSRLSKC